jgi:DNA-binding response OmpR family regulator
VENTLEKLRKKILIVDDDQSVSDTLKRILEAEGHCVDVAKTGGEAIEKSRNITYNLALLDVRLPDMEGTKLLSRIHQGKPRTRMIMITGYPSLENVVEALNQGADGYLIKPIDPAKLVRMIGEQLNHQEAEAKSVKIEKKLKEVKQTQSLLKFYGD